MTEQKSFKRSVRARMEKTGESYATARRELLAKAEREAESASVEGFETPVSEEAVVESTGRRWTEWFAILEAWGGKDRRHPEIARYLMDKQDLDGWWAQSVTVAYERARGMRATGQRADGSFEAGASKTVAAPVESLFEAVVDEAQRERWLPEGALSLRTAKAPKSARFDWEDGTTRVLFGFTAKGESKSQVALVHERLPDADARDDLKAMWRERLTALKEVVEART